MADDAVKPESDESPEAKSEESSEQDLDSLLKDWDENEEEKKAKEPPAPPKEAPRDPMVEELYRRTVEEDLSKAVDRVYSNLEDLPARPNRQVIRHYLEGRAQEDSRLTSAWTQRHQNPDKWHQVIDGLTSEFKKQFEMKEDSSTSEMEAAAAMARGRSSDTPDEPPADNKKLAKMSDVEFRKYVDSLR